MFNLALEQNIVSLEKILFIIYSIVLLISININFSF